MTSEPRNDGGTWQFWREKICHIECIRHFVLCRNNFLGLELKPGKSFCDFEHYNVEEIPSRRFAEVAV